MENVSKEIFWSSISINYNRIFWCLDCSVLQLYICHIKVIAQLLFLDFDVTYITDLS